MTVLPVLVSVSPASAAASNDGLKPLKSSRKFVDARENDVARVRHEDERVGVRRECDAIGAPAGNERIVGIQGEIVEPADGIVRRRAVDADRVRRRIDRRGSRAAELQHQPRNAVADERVAGKRQVPTDPAVERAGEEAGWPGRGDAQIEQQQVAAAGRRVAGNAGPDRYDVVGERDRPGAIDTRDPGWPGDGPALPPNPPAPPSPPSAARVN